MAVKTIHGNDVSSIVTKDKNTIAHITAKGGYTGFENTTGGYLRTPANGLIPNVSGGSGSIGTSTWPFSSGCFNELYVRGKRMNKSIITAVNTGKKSGNTFILDNYSTIGDGFYVSNGYIYVGESITTIKISGQIFSYQATVNPNHGYITQNDHPLVDSVVYGNYRIHSFSPILMKTQKGHYYGLSCGDNTLYATADIYTYLTIEEV